MDFNLHLNNFLNTFVVNHNSIKFNMEESEVYYNEQEPPMKDSQNFILKKLIPPESKYYDIVTDIPIESLNNLSKELPREVCGKELCDETSVKCYTCSQDPCSIMCMDCFDEKLHKNHNYRIMKGLGMCDCGYAQTINPSGFCHSHSGNHHDVDILEENKTFFNIDNLFGVLVYLSRHIVYYAQQEVSNTKYEIFLNCYVTLLFTLLENPNDVFRRAFSYVLIYQDTDKDLNISDLFIKNPFEYIPKYIKIPLVIEMFSEKENLQIMKNLQLGLFFMILNELLSGNSVCKKTDQYFIHKEISEPIFRVFVSYAFYLKNPLICMSCTKPDFFILDGNSHILENKALIPPYNIGSNKKFLNQNEESDLWFNASVQSHNCIVMDDLNIIISEFSEEVETYLFSVRAMLGRFTTNPESLINAFFINTVIEKGLMEYNQLLEREYPYIKNKNEYIQERNAQIQLEVYEELLMNAYFEFPYKKLFSNNEVAEEEIAEHYNAYGTTNHKFNTEIWSLKLVPFMARVYEMYLPTLSILFNFELNTECYIERFRERDCVIDDEQYMESLFAGAFQHRVYCLKEIQVLFVIPFIVLNENEQPYSLSEELIRSCTKHTDINLKNPYNIDCVFEIALHLVLEEENILELNTKEFEDCNHPYEINEGFGLHTQKCELNEAESKFHHPVYNDLIQLLAMMLNIKLLENKNDFELISKYLRDNIILCAPGVLTYHYNISFLLAEATKLIVTKSLFDAKMLLRLGDNTENFFAYIYSETSDKLYYIEYNWYEFIEFTLLSVKHETPNFSTVSYKTEDFLTESLEMFGFYNNNNKQFVFEKEKEDNNRRLKMLGDELKMICVVSNEELILKSPKEHLMLHILLLLMQNKNLSMTTLHAALHNMEYYNYDYIEECFKEIAIIKKVDIEQHIIYKSGGLEDICELNEYGLSLIEDINPFFCDYPEFLFQLEEQIEAIYPDNYKSIIEQRVSHLLTEKTIITEFFTSLENNPLFETLTAFIDIYFFKEDMDKSLVSENEILASILILNEFYENCSKEDQNYQQLIQILNKIVQVSEENELKLGIYLTELLTKFVAKVKAETISETSNSKKKLNLNEKLLKFKNDNRTNELQISELEELKNLDKEEEEISEIDEFIFEELENFENNKANCSICEMEDEDKIMCVTVIATPTSELYNMFVNNFEDLASNELKHNVLLRKIESRVKNHNLEKETDELFEINLEGENRTQYLLEYFECNETEKHLIQLQDNNYNYKDCETILQLRTCTHLIHEHCEEQMSENENKLNSHTCPLCRQILNLTIPVVESHESELLIQEIIKVASAVKELLGDREINYAKDVRFSFSHLNGLAKYLETGDKQELETEELKSAVIDKGIPENFNKLTFVKNEIILLLHLLLDAALHNIILTATQIENDTDKFYNDQEENQLMTQAIEISAYLSFCAKYLFLYVCNLIGGNEVTQLFDFEVEKEKFLNLIELAEDNNECGELELIVQYRKLVLFGRRGVLVQPPNIENTTNELINCSIYKCLNVCNNMFLNKKLDKVFIEEQLDSVELVEKDLLENVENAEIYLQLLEKSITDEIIQHDNTLEQIATKYNIEIIDDLSLQDILNSNTLFEVKRAKVTIDFNKIFPETNFELIENKEELSCERCTIPIVICLFCGHSMCPKCTNLKYHSNCCNTAKAYFCPELNIIGFFNADMVYFSTGPYLSENNEDDLFFFKEVPLERSVKLIKLLEGFLHYNNYYLVDFTGMFIIDLQMFILEIIINRGKNIRFH